MRAPVDRVKVTPHGAYGVWRPKTRRNHYGVDLGGAEGTPVYAPERLVVVVVRRGASVKSVPGFRGIGLDGYGPGAILAVGASGVVHVFGHLAIDGMAALGVEVGEGEQIGRISKLRHLHWEARKGNRAPWPRATRKADTVDPLSLIGGGDGGDGGLLSRIAEKVKSEAKKSAVSEVVIVGALMMMMSSGKRKRRA